MSKSKQLKQEEARERKRESLLTKHLPNLFAILPGGEDYSPTHPRYWQNVNDRAMIVLKMARESQTDLDFPRYWNGNIDKMGRRAFMRIAFGNHQKHSYYIRAFNKYMSIHHPHFEHIAGPCHQGPHVDEDFLSHIED